MNFLLIAGILSWLLGLAHSIIGEKLIFSGWRKSPPDIPRRHYNIIWASWHLVTLMGWGIGGMLIWLSAHTNVIQTTEPLLIILAVSLLASSLLVLYSTRGRHPGWIVLLIIAGLTVSA